VTIILTLLSVFCFFYIVLQFYIPNL
jgi:hypothetical protein